MQIALGANQQALDLHNTGLATAILYTLAYADIFDYPLTLDEIHRYLIGVRATRTEVQTAIEAERQLDGKVVSIGGHFVLAGREKIVVLRRGRAKVAESLWPLAIRVGRAVASLPFVRLAAATGALVSNNVEQGADLDFLVVMKPGYVWVTRAMILALDRIARRRGLAARICPNYIISEDALTLNEQDLFSAQELTRMVPISGYTVYQNMRACNGWTNTFLPNAQGSPMDLGMDGKASRLKAPIEWALSSPPTRWVEKWEMRRKIAKFTRENKLNTETRFSSDYCIGHFDGHKQQTMDAFAARISRLGLNGR
ncbi:MAG: hypothetical protein WD751_05620 [Anaerolineales bacterium]